MFCNAVKERLLQPEHLEVLLMRLRKLLLGERVCVWKQTPLRKQLSYPQPGRSMYRFLGNWTLHLIFASCQLTPGFGLDRRCLFYKGRYCVSGVKG